MGGYFHARGDSAKWPNGFSTASDAMCANSQIGPQKKQKTEFMENMKGDDD